MVVSPLRTRFLPIKLVEKLSIPPAREGENGGLVAGPDGQLNLANPNFKTQTHARAKRADQQKPDTRRNFESVTHVAWVRR